MGSLAGTVLVNRFLARRRTGGGSACGAVTRLAIARQCDRHEAPEESRHLLAKGTRSGIFMGSSRYGVFIPSPAASYGGSRDGPVAAGPSDRLDRRRRML